jgi:hypothetical protein
VPAPAPRAIPCKGDGTSGNRIRFLYGYVQGSRNRLGTLAPRLRTAILQANAVFHNSGRSSGGARDLRAYTDRSCRPVITAVAIPASALRSTGGPFDVLRKKGYWQDDRKYVLLMDTARICGWGTFFADDGKSIGNANNGGHTYARIDSGCWQGGTVIAHEITHMLGGVQKSAPHSNGNGHCRDEHDLMCYNEAGRLRTSIRCPGASGEATLDCGKDDYFNGRPRSGTYLARHWNTADSSFLYGGGPARPALPASPDVRAVYRGARNVSVTWKPRTGRVTAYRVYRNNTLLKTVKPGARSYTDAGFRPGRVTWWVCAVNESGSVCSGWWIQAP